MSRPHALLALCLALALPGVAQDVLGQPTAPARQTDPRRETLTKLSQPMSVGALDNRVQDVLEMVALRTGAELEVSYLTDRNPDGLDPDWTVTMTVGQTTGLELIQRITARANAQLRPASEFEWQMADYGALEIGPKSVLNGTRRTVIYDIHDLLFEVPNFDNAPEFDLSSVLSSGSGGGGGSPFSGGGGNQIDRAERAERAQTLIDLIQSVIEPAEWIDLGGSSSSITYLPEQLIVAAPDYVHRQISGYSYWPKRLQIARVSEGRRSMEIRPDRVP